MKISFSTLGCPDWTVSQAVEAAVDAHYDGIELRFIQGEASLWKLRAFSGMGLQETCREIQASGLAICCVDTSCRFDSPEVTERERWVDEGVRMAELAAQLKAPGIRVFGDKMHPGLNREVTRKWIVESLNLLSEKIDGSGVEVLLETHGDFCCASQVQPILNECPAVRLVWDPAPAFIEYGERPFANGTALSKAVRHVHIKDLRKAAEKWVPALTGEGEFPLAEVHGVVELMEYAGFISFEWEKKWHPEIEPPEVAIPHFANWFRSEWGKLVPGPLQITKA
jgi:sugar phosphate isomerase/epimerase